MSHANGFWLPIWLFPALPAMAEVCDKEAPNWSPPNGRIGYLASLYTDMGNPVVIVLLVIACLCIYTKQTALLMLSTFVCLTFSIFVFTGAIVDDVYWSAIREGCREYPYILIGLFFAIAFGSAALLIRNVRARR